MAWNKYENCTLVIVQVFQHSLFTNNFNTSAPPLHTCANTFSLCFSLHIPFTSVLARSVLFPPLSPFHTLLSRSVFVSPAPPVHTCARTLSLWFPCTPPPSHMRPYVQTDAFEKGLTFERTSKWPC